MKWICTLCLWMLAFAAAAEPQATRSAEPATTPITAAEPISAGQIEVTDGDTIEANGHRYRLIGFDTPEFTSRSRKVRLPEKRLALLAAERLQAIVGQGRLTLAEWQCSCPRHTLGTKRCNFDRKCAVLSQDGTNVGDILIAEGHARRYACSKTKCAKTKPWL